MRVKRELIHQTIRMLISSIGINHDWKIYPSYFHVSGVNCNLFGCCWAFRSHPRLVLSQIYWFSDFPVPLFEQRYYLICCCLSSLPTIFPCFQYPECSLSTMEEKCGVWLQGRWPPSAKFPLTVNGSWSLTVTLLMTSCHSWHFIIRFLSSGLHCLSRTTIVRWYQLFSSSKQNIIRQSDTDVQIFSYTREIYCSKLRTSLLI